MIYFLYIILGFALLQLLVLIYNLLNTPILKTTEGFGDSLVSILIPARNEENNIAKLLQDIENQYYHNIEVIVYNDESTDNTVCVVNRFVQKDHRFRLLQSVGLPDGWLGKTHACYRLANVAKGEFLLFIDADVHIEKHLISSLVAQAEKHNTDLLSIFPKQQLISISEKIIVPIMNCILLSLLPMKLIRASSFASISAANGQCMFFRTSVYHKLEPHKQTRSEKVEDIAIAYLYKKNKRQIDCLLGNNDIQCRMYSNFEEAINGFSKNIIAFFRNSVLFALFFWTANILIIFVMLYLFNIMGLYVYIVLYLLKFSIISYLSNQSIKDILFLQPIRHILLGFIIFVSLKKTVTHSHKWKERSIQ